MTERPVMEVAAVTIGAPDPRGLSAFYAQLLGLPHVKQEFARPGEPPESGWAQVCPADPKAGLTLNFEYEPDYVPPTWPSSAGEPQIMEHLDIAVADLEGSVAWAIAAGATLASYQPQESVRVMLDPAGHPFCLFVDFSLPQAEP